MSKIMFETARGTLSDINEKLAGEDASQYLEHLKAVGRGENPFPVNVVSVPGKATWESKGDLIYITLPPSEGVTGPQWIERLENQDEQLSDDVKATLNSKDFKPTAPGFVYRIVALKATFWKKDSGRTTKVIQAEGLFRKWLELHPEAVCIIRECFSDKQLEKMGIFWIAGIHKPIEVDGDPHFLSAFRHDGGGWLFAFWAFPDFHWGDAGAFAWSLPQENQS